MDEFCARLQALDDMSIEAEGGDVEMAQEMRRMVAE